MIEYSIFWISRHSEPKLKALLVECLVIQSEVRRRRTKRRNFVDEHSFETQHRNFIYRDFFLHFVLDRLSLEVLLVEITDFSPLNDGIV